MGALPGVTVSPACPSTLIHDWAASEAGCRPKNPSQAASSTGLEGRKHSAKGKVLERAPAWAAETSAAGLQGHSSGMK